MITGSVGAFLVLESADSAGQRGAVAMARLGAVAAAATPRASAEAITTSLSACMRQASSGVPDLLVSAATGCALPTAAEAATLDAFAPNMRRVVTGDLVGHAVEAAFPASVALAAGLAAAGEARHVLVTGVGHHRGEGAALVSAL
jgi:3-oxoacyl-[acyl-carrier-protein] synthase II